MLAWIDCTALNNKHKIWGMTILERIIRILASSNITKVFLPLDKNEESLWFRKDFKRSFQIDIEFTGNEKSMYDSLKTIFKENPNELVMLIQGEVLYDHRIIEKLKNHTNPLGIYDSESDIFSGALVIDKTVFEELHINQTDNIETIYKKSISLQIIEWNNTESMDKYILKLRATLKPYMIRLKSEKDIDKAEKYLYNSVYKGVTDIMVKYVYKFPARIITSMLSKTTITPNNVTFLSSLFAFISIPLYATGYMGFGLLVCYIHSLLDVVDGKLARLTYRISNTGNILDHGSDWISLPLWVSAIGWHLSDSLFSGEFFIYSILFIIAYIVNRLVFWLFLRVQKKPLGDFRKLDRYIRLFPGARKQASLVILLIGYFLNMNELFFKILVIFTILSSIFYIIRFLQFMPLALENRKRELI